MVFLLGEGIMDVSTIICIVGQTCSGKDTFAKLLHDKFGYNIEPTNIENGIAYFKIKEPV